VELSWYEGQEKVELSWYEGQEQVELSWYEGQEQVELSWYEGQEKVDLTDYVNSGTWDIIACPGRNEKPSDNADDDGEFSVSQITFTLRIRRKVQLDA